MWGAVAGVVGSMMASRSASKGAKAMRAAAEQQIAFQREMYAKWQKDFAPYREAGEEALPFMRAAASAESPLYALRKEDTEKAIERALAKRGQFFSGAGINTLAESSRRLSAEEAEARWRRSKELAEMGRMATGMMASAQGATGAQVGGAYGQLGRNEMAVAGQKGSAYAGINQAIQGGLSNYYFDQYLQKLNPGSTAPPASTWSGWGGLGNPGAAGAGGFAAGATGATGGRLYMPQGGTTLYKGG